MKYIAHCFLLLIGLGAAFFRWVDLVNFTDLETGFVLVGSVWLRYGALALLLCLALVAQLMASRRASSFEQPCPLTGGLLLLLATALAAHSAVACYLALAPDSLFAALTGNLVATQPMLAWLGMVDTLSLAIALLGLICAVWLCLVAFSQFGNAYRLPAGGVGFGIAGSIYCYAVLIARFAGNQSSYHRIDPTLSVFAAAAALWFFTVLLRAIYYPENAVGRKIYCAGLVCFYLCTCCTLPQIICDFWVGNITLGALSEQLVFALVGLMGAAYATRALSDERAV